MKRFGLNAGVKASTVALNAALACAGGAGYEGMKTLDRDGEGRYDSGQVLVTLRLAVPRAEIAVFLCLPRFAPMWAGPARKDGRTTSSVFETSRPPAARSNANGGFP